MIAEIICVGTELLLGQILNTNARFLSGILAELGLDVYFQQVVGDNRRRLAGCVETAMARSDLLVLSGGLGPTEDDLTKETVADLLGLPLRDDAGLAREMRALLERQGGRVAEAAVAKQCRVPAGAVVLPNDVGTAPGLMIRADSKLVVLLPGPPAELEPMARRHLVPLLEREAVRKDDAGAPRRSFLHTVVVKTCGLGEPAVEEAVRELVRAANPTVAPLVDLGETHLRITGRASSREEAVLMVEEVVARVRERLGDHIFGYDDDTLSGACGRLLYERGLTLVLAESVTGGLIGHLITQTPGSSRYFDRGLVVYSNTSKSELLGVDPASLQRYGAVSGETAAAMAAGARERYRADLGLAVTGIAGPDGGTSAKPVGLVYVALASGIRTEDVVCHRHVFSGDRELVKRRAAHRALALLWGHLRRQGRIRHAGAFR